MPERLDKLLRSLAVVAIACVSVVSGADIRLRLDSADGSSAMAIVDADLRQLFRIDSLGTVQLIGPLTSDGGFIGNGVGLTNLVEADPVWSAVSNTITTQAALGATAHGWGNHAAAGYLTYYNESDPVWSAVSNTVTVGATRGATAHGWGDHAAAGYLLTNTEQVVIGQGASATVSGIAIGHQANGMNSGAAIGVLANANSSGTALGLYAEGQSSGAALGYLSSAISNGVAVGRAANGRDQGVGVGYQANGFNTGTAIGYLTNGRDQGVVVGYQANGVNAGTAIGYQANGYDAGTAIGYQANGVIAGTAIGYLANGSYTGTAVGYGARAHGGNIAIGDSASASAGSGRTAIGHGTINSLDNTVLLRGNLYLDGGSGTIYHRATFGTGGWTTKTFLIDHPLDPENKVLRHFTLEGPEVWNVYAGNAQLVNGRAVVELPDYYSALNKAGSEIYSLTPVGGAFLVGVEQKVSDNRFVIVGHQDAEVSWSIKVLRNDPACLEDLRRRPVEQCKSELVAGQPARENATVNTAVIGLW